MCQPIVIRRRPCVDVLAQCALKFGVEVEVQLAQCALKFGVEVEVQTRVQYAHVVDERVAGGVRQLTGWTREAGLGGVGHDEVD